MPSRWVFENGTTCDGHVAKVWTRVSGERRDSPMRSLQILQTSCGYGFRAFIEGEYLDRGIAVVADLSERLKNRNEIDIAEPRSFQVPIVGVEISEVWRGFPD